MTIIHPWSPFDRPGYLATEPRILQKNLVTVINHPYTPEFKPKKAGTKTAHVVFVLDDSYSMQSCRKSTIDGFNEFLLGQKETDVKTFISLYKFNGSEVQTVFEHTDAALVQPLEEATYNPRGFTNLLDAIGHAMHKVNERLENSKKGKRDSVTIVILTDGQENASCDYTNDSIKSMVEKAEGKEWSFMFLGANIDAFVVGGSLGFRKETTLQYNTTNMRNTLQAASRSVTQQTVMKAAGASVNEAYCLAGFNEEERQAAS